MPPRFFSHSYHHLIIIITSSSSSSSLRYFGGRGLPFYGVHIKGKADPSDTDKTIAKYAFKVHHYTGLVFEYMIPLHVGAVGVHWLQGHNLLKRFF